MSKDAGAGGSGGGGQRAKLPPPRSPGIAALYEALWEVRLASASLLRHIGHARRLGPPPEELVEYIPPDFGPVADPGPGAPPEPGREPASAEEVARHHARPWVERVLAYRRLRDRWREALRKADESLAAAAAELDEGGPGGLDRPSYEIGRCLDALRNGPTDVDCDPQAPWTLSAEWLADFKQRCRDLERWRQRLSRPARDRGEVPANAPEQAGQPENPAASGVVPVPIVSVVASYGPPFPPDVDPIDHIHKAFGRFYETLDATTVPVPGGRRVDGVPHAVALSEATGALHHVLAESNRAIMLRYWTRLDRQPPGITLVGSDSPDGPFEPLPDDKVTVFRAPADEAGPGALLLAALDSARRVAAFPTALWNQLQAASSNGKHQRWRAGDVISDEDLAVLESAAKMLRLYRGAGADDDAPRPEGSGSQCGAAGPTQAEPAIPEHWSIAEALQWTLEPYRAAVGLATSRVVSDGHYLLDGATRQFRRLASQAHLRYAALLRHFLVSHPVHQDWPEELKEIADLLAGHRWLQGVVGPNGRLSKLDGDRAAQAVRDAERCLARLLDAVSIAEPATVEPAATSPQAESMEIAELERITPPLVKHDGQWVNNKTAAELEGLQPRSLASYRGLGIQNAARNLGRDPDGRVWRRTGTDNAHPWYLKITLKSQRNLRPKP